MEPWARVDGLRRGVSQGPHGSLLEVCHLPEVPRAEREAMIQGVGDAMSDENHPIPQPEEPAEKPEAPPCKGCGSTESVRSTAFYGYRCKACRERARKCGICRTSILDCTC